MCRSSYRFLLTILLAAAVASAGRSAGAQFDGFDFGGGTAAPKVSVTAEFTSPSGEFPGRLMITAVMDPTWYIYSITQVAGGPVPTEIKLAPSDSYRLAGEFQANPPPEKKAEKVYDGLIVEKHHNKVTWTAPIEFSPGVDPSQTSLVIEGSVTAQQCDPDTCMMPEDFSFTAVWSGPSEALPDASEIQAEQAGGTPVFDPDSVEPEEHKAKTMLGALVAGFLGGLILNIMPCVLPVIGLKILSFFEQAGKSRSRAFVLNVAYTVGLLTVFMVLAFLGVGLNTLFTQELFGIVMASVVFVMALSLMGVWELRVPGFLSSGKAQAVSRQEGLFGAYSKGIITTLLAIPCGAPLLSPAVQWAGSQAAAGTPENVYIVYAVMALGMGSPYLIMGAFPELLRFLPKPGEWTATFQKAMGYLLLTAVVWILYFMPIASIVPTVGLLFGLWMACWLIGRLPMTASRDAVITSWVLALMVAVTTWAVCFPLVLRPAMESKLDELAGKGIRDGNYDRELVDRMAELHPEQTTESAALAEALATVDPPETDELPWRPFRRSVFDDAIASGRPMLVDFTAEWCLTCKTLEYFVLNTREIREVVDKHDILTLQADWTEGEKEVEITEMLDALGAREVPTLAIFIPGDPNRPIVLRGGYTKSKVIDALERAGAAQ